MRVLLAGKRGQLAYEILRSVPAGVKVTAFSSSELDITERDKVEDAVREISPQVIINAAAYTAVDRAESEPDLAMAVNRDGVANLARAAAACGSFMVHVSTDFVFAGDIARPLRPDDPLSPVGAYGRSKAAGEKEIERIIPNNRLVVRTSWLYSTHGANFVKTMLRLAGERESLSVVCDQVGSPTWAAGLAGAIWIAVAREVKGVHHYADAGVASWYDFAVAIMEEAHRLGIISNLPGIVPIATVDYPTPARRPSYSVLDSRDFYREIGIAPFHWRESLKKCLEEL